MRTARRDYSGLNACREAHHVYCAATDACKPRFLALRRIQLYYICTHAIKAVGYPLEALLDRPDGDVLLIDYHSRLLTHGYTIL